MIFSIFEARNQVKIQEKVAVNRWVDYHGNYTGQLRMIFLLFPLTPRIADVGSFSQQN